AHRGALDAGGRTIAVLGNGVERIYPSDNHELAQRIMRNGAIISEFSIGTPPLANNFPRRNRVISGLSCGVLVGEAPENSGALITVRAALEQGRDVFVVPSNIFNPTGTGANRLIQDGARLVMDAEDILSELNIKYVQAETKQKTEQLVPTTDIESQILQLLETDPVHIDDIIHNTGLPAQDVLSTLVLLELKGLAQVEAPMQYCRARS
ncbi:MAG: DNA-processing protein DprA, partial [Aggregatilineales bacterium]